MNLSTLQYTSQEDIFCYPAMDMSDAEDNLMNEFELFPETQQTNQLKNLALKSSEAGSVLKSKAGITELTRADSESLAFESGQVKSIKKAKDTRKAISKKAKVSKVSKKNKISLKTREYNEFISEEYTCQFRKEFANVRPLAKEEAWREFRFVDQINSKRPLSSFPCSYELEYQQPQDGLSDIEEDFCDYAQNSSFPLKLAKPVRANCKTAKKSALSFKSLSETLLKSKNTNNKAGTACFEVFKSLKVISLVCSYMNNDE